jgi:MELT motif
LISRLFPQAATPTQTPSPKKGVGFTFDGTPSTDNDSTGEYSPPPVIHPQSHASELPRVGSGSPIGSDSEETSMDIADDNLTLPLPSALIKRQLQRGVGFLVDDGNSDDEDEMDVTQPLGGIIPPRDGVNRFLNGDDDQTMEFTRVYPAKNIQDEDDTAGMEFTKVVGKIQGLRIPGVDKENRPPVNEDDGIVSSYCG